MSLNSVPTVDFFHYKLFSGNLNNLDITSPNSHPILINTLNPHSFYIAEKDEEFRKALVESDLLLADGIGIVYGNWLINGETLERISGMDVFLLILKKLEKEGTPEKKKIFFLGSSSHTLELIKRRVKREFPSLLTCVYSPPFKSSFSDTETKLMIQHINNFDPYVLFVGMTAPKQEKWSYTHKKLLNTKIICSIGAVFDFYSENIKRPGVIWQALSLEWFRRLLGEPQRLWRRTCISLPYFLYRVLAEALTKKVMKR